MEYKKTLNSTVKENDDVFKVNNKLTVDCSAINKLGLPKEISDAFKQAIVSDLKESNDYISEYGFVVFKIKEGTNDEVAYSADFTLNRVCVRDEDTDEVKYRGLELSAIRLCGYDLSAIYYNKTSSEYYETGDMLEKCSRVEIMFKYKSEKENNEYGTETENDKLVDSEDWTARCKAAEQGYGLDVLVYDERWEVRCAVAKQGRDKDLDILVQDKNSFVRKTVAEYGRDKDLDVLVHDKSDVVCAEVARQGRPQDLIILENDDSNFVRKAVRDYKAEHPDWNKPKENKQKYNSAVKE